MNAQALESGLNRVENGGHMEGMENREVFAALAEVLVFDWA